MKTVGCELLGSVFRLLGAGGLLGVGIFCPSMPELLAPGVLEVSPLIYLGFQHPRRHHCFERNMHYHDESLHHPDG